MKSLFAVAVSGVLSPMMETVSQVAEVLDVTKATVRRWIAAGEIDAERPNGQFKLIDNEKTNAFLLEKLRDRSNAPAKAWNPKEIRDYSRWHDLIDEMTWLLKVSYGSTDDIKKKHFRLDSLFASYLRRNNITLAKIRAAFRPKADMPRKQIVADLKRGWYNEMAYAMPLKQSTVGLSFSDITLNKSIDCGRDRRCRRPPAQIRT